ncbi:hypothetical protein [Halorussus halobius]|uniref:hypothetical protein n=1 Tax=Halorussus halobius TaxID=1710537 RepID=UPI001091E5D5|nr:hypothetical protein [Halorussus halobius]
MGAIPGDLNTDSQPPMTVPLRHFLVALGFLAVGCVVGLLAALDAGPARAGLAHVHLLLAGWVCVTIMGAMTQFVPVWSGTAIHSRRLSVAQLWLVTLGLAGLAGALLAGALAWTPVFGGLALAGFWTFVYNVGRTLLGVRPFDVTERHFALALGFFLVVTAFGWVLALGYVVPVFEGLAVPVGDGSISRGEFRLAHATLAVFGAILSTVLGALYQLATMFTQTELHGVDVPLRRFEEVGYPAGVVALAAGRLLGLADLARVGGVLVAAGLLGFAVVLARRLYETRVERTPMLSRYAVVPVAVGLWVALAIPAWLAAPLAPAGLFGAPGTAHLLAFGVVGFVVVGTVYHVVPFVVWVHRYSDLLGFEDVPMIDDLYDGRLAAVDFWLLAAGVAGLVAGDLLGTPGAVAVGGVCTLAGVVVFSANVLLVVRRHGPHSVLGVLWSRFASEEDTESSESVGGVS